MKFTLVVTAFLALALVFCCGAGSFMSRQVETVTGADTSSDPETRFV